MGTTPSCEQKDRQTDVTANITFPHYLAGGKSSNALLASDFTVCVFDMEEVLNYILLLLTLFSVHTLTVGGDLGPLGTLTIWHDDSGSNSDWYLQKVKSKYQIVKSEFPD